MGLGEGLNFIRETSDTEEEDLHTDRKRRRSNSLVPKIRVQFADEPEYEEDVKEESLRNIFYLIQEPLEDYFDLDDSLSESEDAVDMLRRKCTISKAKSDSDLT